MSELLQSMIAKCQGKQCEERNGCYRYRSFEIGDQLWDNFDERRGSVQCNSFIALHGHHRVAPADWLDIE